MPSDIMNFGKRWPVSLSIQGIFDLFSDEQLTY